jgi:YVTN family beta-propeller protein
VTFVKIRYIFLCVFILFLAGSTKRSTSDALAQCWRPQSTYPGNLRMDNIHMVALTPDGKELWAYGVSSPFIAIVDTTSPDYPVVGTVQIPGDHRVPISQIIFSSDGRYAYMTNSPYLFAQERFSGTIEYNNGQILVVDVATRCVSAIIKTDPIYVLGSLALSPDGSTLFMTAIKGFYPDDNGILRVDLRTKTLMGFVQVPGLTSLVTSADGRYLYCSRISTTGTPSPGFFSIVDAQTLQITASVTVGDWPACVAITPDGSTAGVTNLNSGSVSIINLSSMTVSKTITLGVRPQGIVASRDGKKMYVGSSDSISDLPNSMISVIDLQSESLKTYINVHVEPDIVVLHPDGTRLFVSSGNANGTHPAAVHLIDTTNDIYVQPIILRESALYAPTGIATTPDGKRLFALSEARQTLLTIDVPSHSLIRELSIRPRALAVSKDGSRLFVFSPHYPSDNQGKLLVLDTQSLEILYSIDLGNTQTFSWWDTTVDCIVLDSKETTAYLTAGDLVQVIIVDLVSRQVKVRIPVGKVPANARGLALTPDDRLLFVSDNTSNRIVVVDTISRSAIATILGNQPTAIKISTNGERAYVFQQQTGILSIIDVNSLTITKSVNLPGTIGFIPDFIFSTDEQTVIVPCFDPNWIMVFDLSETSPDKQVKTLVYSGLDPLRCAVTADNRLLFVTNFSSDTISVLDMVSRQIVDTIPIGNAYANLAQFLSGNTTQLPARFVNPHGGLVLSNVSGTGDVNSDRKVNAIDLMMLRLQQK